ncbi:MAG: hypothetical protein COY80_01540 [Candidatus Pacebacteria bacterium CG_4_10_14_0_8_um_filter_42_14]|nr:MAG: hypothetical protein COY80_01540 [Candidatus Pacebacteria bacterium CG_4_10_14_0_8_um_filter_42_14]
MSYCAQCGPSSTATYVLFVRNNYIDEVSRRRITDNWTEDGRFCENHLKSTEELARSEGFETKTEPLSRGIEVKI